MAQPTIKGSASAASTSVTLPAHAAGDLIVIFTFKDGATTVPTTPTAGGTVPTFTLIDGPTGANTCASKTAYAVATSSSHTSGVWTGATGIVVYVISGQDDVTPIGGHAMSGSTGSGTVAAPAITQSVTDGSSLILEFFGHRTVTAWSAATSGYTMQTSVATEVASTTKDSTTSDGAVSQSCTTSASSGYRGATVEILALQTGVKRITGGLTTVAQRTSVAITVPSNAVNGDWLYIYIERDAGQTAFTLPSGVTQQATRLHATGPQGYVFRHKVNSTAGTTLTLSWAGATDWSQAGYDLFRNADTTEPEDTTISQADGASTSAAAPSITTVTDKSLLVAVCLNVDGATHTAPTGMTKQLDDSHAVCTATVIKSPAGATGTETFTITSMPWLAFLIALKPASSGGVSGIAATIASKATVSGSARLVRRVNTTISSKATVTSTLRVTRRLNTTIASKATVSGNARRVERVSSTIASKATVTSAARMARRLSSTIASKSGLSGTPKITLQNVVLRARMMLGAGR